mgnify:FL=1
MRARVCQREAAVTLARAEFCQKSVDYLSKWLQAKNPEIRRMYERCFNRCAASFLRGNFAPIAKLFGLTASCVEEFADIYKQRISDRSNEPSWNPR